MENKKNKLVKEEIRKFTLKKHMTKLFHSLASALHYLYQILLTSHLALLQW